MLFELHIEIIFLSVIKAAFEFTFVIFLLTEQLWGHYIAYLWSKPMNKKQTTSNMIYKQVSFSMRR